VVKTVLLLFSLLITAISFSQTLEYGELSGNYSLLIPEKNMKRLIVALHGSGERANMYIDNWEKEAVKLNYYILAINSGNQDGWSTLDTPHILSLVNEVKQKYGIKYTLLNGASSGGHFALYLGINYPEYFNAIATFMGLVITPFGQYINYQTLEANKIPILLIHGQKDDKIPISYARQNYQFLQNKKYNVTYWEEKEMQHEHYRKDNSKIISWFEALIKKLP